MKNKALLYLTTLLLAFGNVSADKRSQPNYPQGFEPKESNAIRFTENKNQVHDQNNKPRPDVLFSGNDGGFVFHLNNNGISYQFYKTENSPVKENVPVLNSKKEIAVFSHKRKKPEKKIIYRLDVKWLNINEDSHLTKGKAFEDFDNYYSENCSNGLHKVKSYESVTYHNIYNGIDLKWYQKDGRLKYDYIVAAGADYKKIVLEINGADEILLNKKGELIIKTPLGNVSEEPPLVIQNGKPLKAKWLIKGNKISFEIEKINPSQKFIIDPAIRSWGTYYGGNMIDELYTCSTDTAGNVYVSGLSESFNAIATIGAHQTTFAGGWSDAILVKFNSAGVRQWGTYYGGSKDEDAPTCATDISGNIYLAGYAYGIGTQTLLATPGSHQPVGYDQDAFLVKFNSSGVRIWGTYYGGRGGGETGHSVCTDVFGNVYLAGFTNSAFCGDTIATTGTHQPNYGGGLADGFVAKFNSAGVRQWGTYYGGTLSEAAYSCSVDKIGSVFIAGLTESTNNISSMGSHQVTFAGGGLDAFLVKLNSSGIRQWGTYYGGYGDDRGWRCVTDSVGSIYLTGRTNSDTGNVIATLGSHQFVYGGASADGFLAKFDGSGTRLWGTYYGGTQGEEGTSLTTDPLGNVYLAGYTGSDSVIATNGSHLAVKPPGGSIFLSKFNTSGIRQWGTYYPGSITTTFMGGSFGNACSANRQGSIFLTGFTGSLGCGAVSTIGCHQYTNGGSTEGFLVKFNDCNLASPTISTSISNQTLCVNSTATLGVTGFGILTWFTTPSCGVSFTTGPVYITPVMTTPGTYSYYVVATNSCGVSPVVPITVTVVANPTITVNSGSICSGQNFTMSPSGASSYTFEGGNSVVSPTANATYTVIGANASGCISNIVTSSVNITTTPTIIVNSGYVCIGNSFTLNPIGASSYTYEGGSAVVSPTTSSTYSVIGSIGSCLSAPATSSVNVNPLPLIAVNSGTICAGESFTMIPSGANTYTFQGGNATVSPTSNTSYSVIGSSTLGCISSPVTSNVVVNPTPTLTINNGTVCSGSNFVLIPGGAISYTYQNGGPIVNPTVTTSYSVVGSNTIGCSSQTISSVFVNPLPIINVTTSDSVICGPPFQGTATLTATGANTYSWNPAGSGSSVVISLVGTFVYTVTGTDANNCVNTSTITQYVSSCIGINEISWIDEGITIYPNPFNNKITIQVNSDKQNISLFNSLGSLIYKTITKEEKTEIDLTNYSSGIYFIRIGSKTFKLVKE